MRHLHINFEHCYGIGKLSHEFDFSEKNAVVIYAPNGMMKTSFAKTFQRIADGAEPEDLLRPGTKSVCIIRCDGAAINPEQIYVANPDDLSIDSSKSISALLVRDDLKQRYEQIRHELDETKKRFLSKLKKLSGSSDCEGELFATFCQQSSSNDDYDFAIYERILPEVENARPNQWQFHYNDVFDKAGKVKEFLDEHHAEIDDYFQAYKRVLTSSPFFRTASGSEGTSFDPSRAETLEKSVKDGAFFEAGHAISISGGTTIHSHGELENLRKREVERILSDPQVKTVFDDLNRSLGANASLKTFRDAISKQQNLLLELRDYAGFRKKVWYSFVAGAMEEFRAVVESYRERKEELETIFREAREELPKWHGILDIFNTRFHAPFKVSIENQRDLLLNGDAPALKFSYNRDGQKLPCEKQALMPILSKGELRAFVILQMVFQIEARKSRNDNFLIFDDIADSFDYKNKFAIIEYLADYLEDGRFKVVILTHNFDFYRTVVSRLGLRRDESSLMALKGKGGEIHLKPAVDINDVFGRWLDSPTSRTLLAMIPFVRNLSEYFTSQQGRDYCFFTHCLHYKCSEMQWGGMLKATNDILTGDILGVYQQFFPNRVKLQPSALSTLSGVDCKMRFVDWLKSELENIDRASSRPNFNEISLDNKVVLSIGIRLMTEKFVIDQLNQGGQGYTLPARNQTRYLIEEYRKRFSACHEYDENCAILSKVAMMTPEQIHLNSFMYEPLVDMSVRDLLKLYEDVSSWNVVL